MSNIIAPLKQSQQNLKDNFEHALEDDELILDRIKLALKSSDKKIIANLRGFKFELFVKTFSSYPSSRLAKLSILIISNSYRPNNDDLFKLCDHYDMNKMEFYFNQDPFMFNKILNLYNENVNQKIHIDEGVCFNYLNSQLDYWGLENKFDDIIDKCCKTHLNARKTYINDEIEKEDQIIKLTELKHDFKYRIFFPELREKIFNYMEYSNNYLIGRVFFCYK